MNERIGELRLGATRNEKNRKLNKFFFHDSENKAVEKRTTEIRLFHI